MRTPEGGIQPQTAVDSEGTVHLIFFKGEPAGGDLFYVRRTRTEKEFSAPKRVNSRPASAIATGTIRGGQMAVGRSGRVHVAWNGSGKATPRGPGKNGTPMLYTRLNDAGDQFEPERNVVQYAWGLDGGGTVAADQKGNVYVAWHGNPQANGEEHRRVYVAVSRDDGKTFAKELPALDEPTGACGCCGMKAFADREGNLYMLYRTARETVHRDMYLLSSLDQGKSFSGSLVQQWNVGACPMSSEALAQGPASVYAGWETDGQVYLGKIEANGVEVSEKQSAPGDGSKRKHPAIAVNKRGETILVWTEGTGWKRGGSLAWQVYDASGHPTSSSGRQEGIGVWSFAAVFANPSGDGFTIVY